MKIVQTEKTAWDVVVQFVQSNRSFSSVTGIEYQARISGNNIYYQGGKRNGGDEEGITKEEFVKAFASLRLVTEINTNTIKSIIPNSLYRKRTPFIGLLYSSGLIE